MVCVRSFVFWGRRLRCYGRVLMLALWCSEMSLLGRLLCSPGAVGGGAPECSWLRMKEGSPVSRPGTASRPCLGCCRDPQPCLQYSVHAAGVAQLISKSWSLPGAFWVLSPALSCLLQTLKGSESDWFDVGTIVPFGQSSQSGHLVDWLI